MDSSKNTMTPKDSSVAETGNDELSELDIKKLNCLYHCDGCGGHLEGVDDTSTNHFSVKLRSLLPIYNLI